MMPERNGSSSPGSAETETEILPPYVPPGNEPTRVRVSRETMQNPCFWILIGAVGAVAVGAAIIWVSNNNRD